MSLKIKKDIEKQHKLIKTMKKRWHEERLDNIVDLKNWTYELLMLSAFHFYTEGYYFTDSDQRHERAHRDLLNLLLKVLSMEEIENAQKGIDFFLDDYLTNHLEMVDPTLIFKETKNLDEYFTRNFNQASVIIIQFKNGFISAFFGTVSRPILIKYYEILEKNLLSMSKTWSKIVDLSRWNLTTLESVDLAIERNKNEELIGCQSVVFYTKPHHLSKYIIEKIAESSQHIQSCYSLKNLVSSGDFKAIVEEKPLAVHVIGSIEVIMEYYENLLQ